MNTSIVLVAAAGLLLFTVYIAVAESESPTTQSAEATTQPTSVLGFTIDDNAGNPVDLSNYEGKVLLIVNTASQCGLTPQYAGLQKLYEEYEHKGLAILAFPANEFGEQEPGSDKEIRQFCTEKYNVTFDLFAKSVVKGDEISPLYKFLTEEQTNPEFPGEIQWNFTKFLISRDGKIVARFEPKIAPDDKDLVAVLEQELDKEHEVLQ